MTFDTNLLDSNKMSDLLLSIVLPRPIALVTSLNTDGSGVNIAPFSLFNLVSLDPPVLYFSVLKTKPPKRTATNIKTSGEFVVNIPNYDIAEKMNKTASPNLRTAQSKFDSSGLTEAESQKIKTFGVKESLIRLECTLHSTINFDNFEMFLGNIVNIYCDDTILDDAQVSTEKHKFISRLGSKELYLKIMPEMIFTMKRAGEAESGD